MFLAICVQGEVLSEDLAEVNGKAMYAKQTHEAYKELDPMATKAARTTREEAERAALEAYSKAIEA